MNLFHEVRIAARRWLRRPGFSLLAVATLAIGIGSVVAIFSVFHAVLLRPLPFEEPERLVSIWEKNPERDWHQAQVAAANFLDWRARTTSFDDMASHNDWLDERVLMENGEPEVVFANEVTGNFFEVLGVAPLVGRVFDEGHTWAGAEEPAVVLSARYWRRRFGSDRSILGRQLELDGVAHRILGVMPPGFVHPFRETDLWVPVGWRPELRERVSFRRAHGMRVIGRLADGASLEGAEAELAAVAAALESEYPETNRMMGTGVTPLQEWIVGDTRRPLQILMAAMAFVLLVACTNVSNMLLARASGRGDELRIRSALGGGRGRLVLEALVEGGLLAFLGGGLGLLLGVSAIGPLVSLSPENLPRVDEITFNPVVLFFTVGVTLAAALLFGFAPALRSSNAGIPSSARSFSQSRRARRASAILVASEVALTMPLVVGAGLMFRTLGQLSKVEPGFVAESVLVAGVMLPGPRYDSDVRISSFYRELLEEIRAIGGVEEASMSSRLPFGNQRWSSDFTAEGWPADRYGVGVRHDEIAPGMFRTLRVPLLRGRDFDFADDLDSEAVVIINEALADTFFPGEDPIGKRVTFDRVPDESSFWRTIVGVVSNVRREALSLEEEPSFYAPVLQDTTAGIHVLVRTAHDPDAVVSMVRQRVRSLDPALPLVDVTTLEAVVAESTARERFLLVLLTVAAGIALGLASVGIFGVVLHSTTRRVREIGIRLALGARGRSILALVIGGGLKPVLAGLALGIPAAALLARAMSSLLYGVEPIDFLTFAVVVALVLAAAVTASAVPARRASRVDASRALRTE